MLKNKSTFLILLGILIAQISFAAEFKATVSESQVGLGESIRLNLSLRDAKPEAEPDLRSLAKDFNIYSQQQFSSYTNNNGVINSETGWEIGLLPKKTGDISIPSISIRTNKGSLSSQIVNIKVSATQGQTGNVDLGVSLISSTNKSRIYLREPIIYTLKIISYKPIINLIPEDIKTNDAIIDKIGEPKQYTQDLGGRLANIIEIKYQIVPLITGKIDISPAIIHGEVQGPSRQTRNNKFGMFNNFFFDNMQSFQPFVLQSDKITLSVDEAPVKDKNWLPVYKLELAEEWTGLSGARVGDNIVRKIKIKAHGSLSNQLPSMKQFVEIENTKIYVDNPLLTDNIQDDADMVIGTKEETFSIIPTQAGKLKFQPIKIAWWNINTKRMEYSSLPAKTIDILPTKQLQDQDLAIDYTLEPLQNIQNNNFAGFINIIKNKKIWVILISALLTIIFCMTGLIIYLIRKRKNDNLNEIIMKNTKNSRITAKITQKIISVNDLKTLILEYAVDKWDFPNDFTLNKLSDFLSKNNYNYDLLIYEKLFKNINASLYANLKVDLQEMCKDWEKFKASVIKNRKIETAKAENNYTSLNPT